MNSPNPYATPQAELHDKRLQLARQRPLIEVLGVLSAPSTSLSITDSLPAVQGGRPGWRNLSLDFPIPQTILARSFLLYHTLVEIDTTPFQGASIEQLTNTRGYILSCLGSLKSVQLSPDQEARLRSSLDTQIRQGPEISYSFEDIYATYLQRIETYNRGRAHYLFILDRLIKEKRERRFRNRIFAILGVTAFSAVLYNHRDIGDLLYRLFEQTNRHR